MMGDINYNAILRNSHKGTKTQMRIKNESHKYFYLLWDLVSWCFCDERGKYLYGGVLLVLYK